MNIEIEDSYKSEFTGNLKSTLDILLKYDNLTNENVICEYATIKNLIDRVELNNENKKENI